MGAAAKNCECLYKEENSPDTEIKLNKSKNELNLASPRDNMLNAKNSNRHNVTLILNQGIYHPVN
jgi:hypothetical protein